MTKDEETQRRWLYAAMAMQGILSNHRWAADICSAEKIKGNVDWEHTLAKDCVALADALIAACDDREKLK